MIKSVLRDKFKKINSSFSSIELNGKSKAVINQLLNSDYFIGSETIFTFVSKDDEVFTHDMVKVSSKKYVVPVVKNKKMILARISCFEDLKRIGMFGVLEPSEYEVASPDEIDLVLVPGVAFDKRGFRLGRGGGFYDSILPGIKGLKIGLAFDHQVVDEVPVDPWDVPVDVIITEKKIISCNRNIY